MDPEDEFDTTIGHLVNQFKSLPPPIFGEPPAIPRMKRVGARRLSPTLRRWMLLIFVISFLVGGGAALGMFLFMRSERAAQSQAPAAATQALVAGHSPRSSVEPLAVEGSRQPRVEPLAE